MQKSLFTQKSTRKKLFKKTTLVLLLFGIFCLHVSLGYAQDAGNTVRGVITDENGETMPGVSITVKGSTRGVATDLDGSFSINVKPEDVLILSFLGYQDLEVKVGSQKQIDVQLQPKTNELDEVTVVAFGKQRKASVVSSVQTINAKELRVPSSNLTTAFAGRIAGMISYQTSGEPGYDDASFFIRGVTSFGAGKVDPLILIDNVEVSTRDLARLHPDDIQSFSILKDAAATALYGARGANGVVMVTTKEGKEGKAKVSFRIENSFSSPTSTIKMADPITYMKLANEAALTRNPLARLPYSNSQIDNTSDPNRNQNVYPAVDWMDMLTKDVTINQRGNLSISGGGPIARYYIAGSFAQDNGILNVDKRNNFNTNVNLKQYLVHSNININLTKSTEAIVRVHGTFEDYTGPINGGSDMYQKILQVSPVRFPAYFEPDEKFRDVGHILFGGFETTNYMNPYAEMVRGYRQESKSTMLAQFELKQDFDQWVKGLTGRLLGNTIRNSAFDLSRSYNPYYYMIGSYDKYKDVYTLRELNPNNPTGETLSYYPGAKTVTSSFYGEASLAYNNTFNKKHGISGMLVGTMRNALTANAITLAESLPQRNLSLAGRFTYSFDERYFSEFNFGYNGSEKFDKGHRWGFFPSAGVGWLISNESFWNENLKAIVSKLKLRGTYGMVGNDDIGTQRFFYISDVDITGGNYYSTGYEKYGGISHNGVKVFHYANPEIGWETAYKTNIGLELGLFKDKVEIQADIFQEHRTNILQSRANVPTEMGLWSTPDVNVGEAKGKGIDISVDYNHSFNHDTWIVGRANFTYAHSVFKYYEEPDFARINIPWRSKTGSAISQPWGYVAERLFIDDADVANSARQDFSQYGPGDIKYKDINGDNVINEVDMVPIGRPLTPEINYGFGVSAGYKNFDISCFFSGSSRYSFFVDASAMSPFIQSTSDGRVLERGLVQFIADDHWSEDTQNPYAAWPRLSNYSISNNTQQSTFWLHNGSFLRLKSAEIGYSLPTNVANKAKLGSLRFYLSGTNLLLFSKFNLWDIEMGGRGLNYPLQRVINMGLNLTF